MQIFIGSAVMQDGQAPSTYHPDCHNDDLEDLENFAPSDSETEARTTSLDAGWKNKGGTFNSSLERFKAKWSDDNSVSKLDGPDVGGMAQRHDPVQGRIVPTLQIKAQKKDSAWVES